MARALLAPPLPAGAPSLRRKIRLRPRGEVVATAAAALPRRLLTDILLCCPLPRCPTPPPCCAAAIPRRFCLLDARRKFLWEFERCNCPPRILGPPRRLCPMRFAIFVIDDVRLILPALNWSVTL
uniref:Putative secreted protein n=1 Tax=Lutzomyia longipalpis TaxID=7200 RepID=A0A7G3ALE2_LUTLO